MSKQTSKKICFIASHFPQGGAERQITELIKGLIERGYQITLICYQSNVIFFREIKELNIADQHILLELTQMIMSMRIF